MHVRFNVCLGDGVADMTQTTDQHLWLQSRKITPKLLDEFEEWTRTAPMFIGSPQGASFGEELRAVFALAKASLR